MHTYIHVHVYIYIYTHMYTYTYLYRPTSYLTQDDRRRIDEVILDDSMLNYSVRIHICIDDMCICIYIYIYI